MCHHVITVHLGEDVMFKKMPIVFETAGGVLCQELLGQRLMTRYLIISPWKTDDGSKKSPAVLNKSYLKSAPVVSADFALLSI